MISKYMDMLVECLEKKNQILDSLTVLNKKQTELIQNEEFSLAEFDKCVDEGDYHYQRCAAEDDCPINPIDVYNIKHRSAKVNDEELSANDCQEC